MHTITDLSLVTGPVPPVVTVLGILALLWLIFSRSRRHVLISIPVCIVAAIAITLVLYWLIEKVWHPFPDPIARPVYVWIGLGILGVLLGVSRVFAATRIDGRVLTVVSVLLVVVSSAAHVNLQFQSYPTLGTALGLSDAEKVSLADLDDGKDGAVPVSQWKDPADMPSAGKVSTVTIAGTVSGFSARDAEIYLPPAYFTNPRPELPVLVLLAGQPGAPEDWLQGGRLVQTMDAYAAAHSGLAPVVVVADGTGSELANPLCVDSQLGNVATYLSRDVPDWVRGNLQVDPDPRKWAIGGLSYGGTCAFQMATNFPAVYPTFLDLSGQIEPTLGDRKQTVDAAFGGNDAAFVAVNPQDLLREKKFPDSAGVFVVGKQDNDYRPGLQTLYEAAKAAGMDVQYAEVDGGHSFQVWSAGLASQLGWLGTRLGLPG